MTEMTMLDLNSIDLGTIESALEDHSGDPEWWIDAETGQVWPRFLDGDDDPEFDPEMRADARAIGALPSGVGYRDMEDFIPRVPDRRAAELLERAIAGRGAFRRFKDTLFEFPDLREAWFTFRDIRMRRRAIEFLLGENLIAAAAAEAALAELSDPPRPSRHADPHRVAEAVAADLARLYGSRLRHVFLYGSHARGDAHPDSDLDLAVVLGEMPDAWAELRRMDATLWEHTLTSGITVSATPVSAESWDAASSPALRSAKNEGLAVA